MALFREPPKCHLCGEIIGSPVIDTESKMIGDNFIRWHYFKHICKNLKAFNKKVKDGEYVIAPEYHSLFGTVKHYLSETNVMISCNDYNCLSDAQKEKCKPVYK